MKKVLVIGANGFLGRNVAKKCISLGWITDAVVNKGHEWIPEGVRNIYNVQQLEKTTETEYDFIINTAAFIPYGYYNTPNPEMLSSNISLPLSLHNMHPYAKIVFSSSVSVYGNNTGVINEKSDTVSPTLYGLSKLSGELIAQHHTSFAIVRFSSLYGKGMYNGSFIPRVVNDAKTKNKLLVGFHLNETFFLKSPKA
jgi:nucleoside-diphosphate-sugar epimerase